MERFRYSYNLIGFGDESVSESIERLAHLGYDAAEVEGEPEKHDPKSIKKLATAAGLSVSSVCPNFTAGRDLSHPDPEVRREAKEYIRRVCELASVLEAPLVIVAPTAYSRTQPLADPGDEWSWAVESIREAGEHAAPLGVDLALECWNRYGTHLLNRLGEGARMWRETGLENGGVMADTFHMNVEERSLPDAIREIGPLLNHVHLADSNRLAPGLGHTDFEEILRTLLEVDYRGYLTFELIPSLPNLIDEPGARTPSLDGVTRQAMDHLRSVERRLAEVPATRDGAFEDA